LGSRSVATFVCLSVISHHQVKNEQKGMVGISHCADSAIVYLFSIHLQS
jgi:hypothetical protein